MKNPFVPPVGEIIKVRPPIARIYWPSINGGQTHFPIGSPFWNNCNEKVNVQSHHIGVFFNALTQAINRVWIIDKFLLSKGDDQSKFSGLELLCLAMEGSVVRSLRILASSKKIAALSDAEMRIASVRNKPKHERQAATEIKIKGHLKSKVQSGIRLVHDRFAIVDDSLWHFGSTVGGVHLSINAASGPWCAIETKAIEFFEQLWKMDK